MMICRPNARRKMRQTGITTNSSVIRIPDFPHFPLGLLLEQQRVITSGLPLPWCYMPAAHGPMQASALRGAGAGLFTHFPQAVPCLRGAPWFVVCPPRHEAPQPAPRGATTNNAASVRRRHTQKRRALRHGLRQQEPDSRHAAGTQHRHPSHQRQPAAAWHIKWRWPDQAAK